MVESLETQAHTGVAGGRRLLPEDHSCRDPKEPEGKLFLAPFERRCPVALSVLLSRPLQTGVTGQHTTGHRSCLPTILLLGPFSALTLDDGKITEENGPAAVLELRRG